MSTLQPQSNGSLYSNTAIGTLAVDEWAVKFETGLGWRGHETLCWGHEIRNMYTGGWWASCYIWYMI